MLPSTFQFIIAMPALALTDRLTTKMTYMREERVILIKHFQDRFGKVRLTLTLCSASRFALSCSAGMDDLISDGQLNDEVIRCKALADSAPLKLNFHSAGEEGMECMNAW